MERDHEQCFNCRDSFCTKRSHCPVEYCKNGCGFSLHSCKWAEHDRHTCPEASVPCTNSELGCKELLRRRRLWSHLSRCPASVLQCRFAYTRRVSAKLGECALELDEPGRLIDEKLLDGDASLLQDSSKLPCLALTVENFSYQSLRRHRQSWTRAPSSGSGGGGGESPLDRGRMYEAATNGDIHAFFCNEVVRREEFVPHWKNFHLDIQLGPLVHRCPFVLYGCTHGQANLLPQPVGTSLKYDKQTDCFLASPPTHPSEVVDPSGNSGDADGNDSDALQGPISRYAAKIQEKRELLAYGYGDDEDESFDVLGQLPLEVLLKVFGYADSVTLWSLSMVNQYFRRVCFMLLKKRGIVYYKWTKDACSSASKPRWMHRQVWSFSKVSDSFTWWAYGREVPPMCAHVASCNVYKSIFKTQHTQEERIRLTGM